MYILILYLGYLVKWNLSHQRIKVEKIRWQLIFHISVLSDISVAFLPFLSIPQFPNSSRHKCFLRHFPVTNSRLAIWREISWYQITNSEYVVIVSNNWHFFLSFQFHNFQIQADINAFLIFVTFRLIAHEVMNFLFAFFHSSRKWPKWLQ